MSDLKLGVLIDDKQQRDAIHVAVAPVIAAETLYPGQHIGFVNDDKQTVGPIADGARGFQNKPALGIVDPFLTTRVLKGERCWMFLYPQTITSLRHDWTHPAFEGIAPAYAPETVSRQAIARIAAELDLTYTALMDAAKLWIECEEHTVQYGSEHWRDTFTPAMAREFWQHYEVVTGNKVADHEATFFSCSC